MVSAIAVVLVTVGVIRAADAFRSASFHSGISSMRDVAAISALVACVFSVAVLALGAAAAVILIRSMLRPLHHLQADAVELAEVRLPDALRRLDHIAARMRRYSQNLLVLAGHDLPGRWNEPVTLVNVMRAAVSEIEDYERVSFSLQPGLAISGPAVNDVVHLIAELAENATSLSAADTPVDISGRTLASGGLLVEVTDQGVGMNPDEMAQANWRLDHPSATDITGRACAG
jgi:hypothetical protein